MRSLPAGADQPCGLPSGPPRESIAPTSRRSSASTPGCRSNEEVQALFRQIEAWIQQESTQIVGRKVAFDSQILGDAERILRSSLVLNTASATFQSVDLHPGPSSSAHVSRALPAARPALDLRRDPAADQDQQCDDHDNIGPIYSRVITEIRGLSGVSWAMSPFTSGTGFKLEGRSLPRFTLEADWTLETTKLYIGVETTELTDAQCDELMSKNMTDWKLGSGDQVDTIFTKASRRAENESAEPGSLQPCPAAMCILRWCDTPSTGKTS